MIIVKVQGGLGNQMFQYAFYLSAKKKYADVKIDNSVYQRTRQHNGYELERIFGIQADVATEKEIKQLNCDVWRLFPKIKRHIVGFPPNYKRQPLSVYDPFIIQDGCYYDGTWANCKYFSDVKDEIVQVFGREQNVCGKNEQILREIQSVNSVAVHIRRGDYVNNPRYDGICTIEYYQKAINILKDKLDNPKFFFFSDDTDYVRKYFSEEAYQIISWNQGENAYMDQYLMSRAKHNIIAHSTFSWWAAWLNKNPKKIVMAPKYWINRAKEARSTVIAQELLPSGWIGITSDAD